MRAANARQVCRSVCRATATRAPVQRLSIKPQDTADIAEDKAQISELCRNRTPHIGR
jgi:hypothetical protein